ncbi:DUF6600 domain-containing protein [Rufibacter hautae]|uniref:BcpO-related WXXGXW repeat protein n=1 Tax=Rufibacter hautae TaxID=2595005 RepID=A0A5B6TD67_9BACT|nr:DUF6600 domain-containing protein [Rufibacter hautae]KAA3436964.1 hypothetical protein FOA19_21555 [Rufibacter hautae]
MKTFLNNLWVWGALLLLTLAWASPQEAQARPGDQVSFQTFYDELDRHGRWIRDPEYGYVWSPTVERGFQPYATRGHWVMTEYGNTWVSDYDWGWAPFHYGRWIYDDFEGWLWIPGSEWGPAWVDWRNGGGYYGWAPMGPRVTYIVPAVRWVFVPVLYITSPRIYDYCVPRTRVVNIYHNTTIINNYYERDNRRYNYGPRNQDIERATNRKVNVYRVDRDSRPGRTSVAENSVRIYRPDVNSRREEAPTRLASRDNTRSRLSDNQGTVGRTDRSSNSRTGVESGSTRGRTMDGGTATQNRSDLEQTSEQRSTTGEYGERTRESSRRTSSVSGEEAPQTRTARPEYQQRTEEVGTVETKTRTGVQESRQRSEGGYSPRRTEAPSSQGQYEPRTRQESSSQGQYQQQRTREVSAPAPQPRSQVSAPTQQRQSPARQESSSGSRSESSRRGRN